MPQKFDIPTLIRSKFGKSRLTIRDFLKLIDACRIELVLSSDVRKGYYYYCSKTTCHVIALSTKLGNPEWLEIAWHEFAHFLQNFRNPVAMRANYGRADRELLETMADRFASICVTGIADDQDPKAFLAALTDAQRSPQRKRKLKSVLDLTGRFKPSRPTAIC